MSTVTLALDAEIATVSALRVAAHRKAHIIAELGADPGQREFLDDLRLELEWTRAALRAFTPEVDVDETVAALCWTRPAAAGGIRLCHAPLSVEALVGQRATAGVLSPDEAWRVVLDAAGCTSTTVSLQSTPVYEIRSVIGRAHIATKDNPEARRQVLLAAAVIEGGKRP